MRKAMRKRIRIAPIAVVCLAIMLLTDRTGLFPATILAALFHEAGHILAAILMKIPLASMRFDLFGARLEVRGRLLSYGEEWLLAAAGPIFSLIGSAIAFPLWATSSFFYAFSVVSMALGLLNLLPVKSFDGGRMTETFLVRVMGVEEAASVMNAITFLLLLLLWLVSVYLLLRAGGGFSLFCFSLTLFARFLENGKIA